MLNHVVSGLGNQIAYVQTRQDAVPSLQVGYSAFQQLEWVIDNPLYRIMILLYGWLWYFHQGSQYTGRRGREFIARGREMTLSAFSREANRKYKSTSICIFPCKLFDNRPEYNSDVQP